MIQAKEKTELAAGFPRVKRPSGIPRLAKPKPAAPTELEPFDVGFTNYGGRYHVWLYLAGGWAFESEQNIGTHVEEVGSWRLMRSRFYRRPQ